MSDHIFTPSWEIYAEKNERYGGWKASCDSLYIEVEGETKEQAIERCRDKIQNRLDKILGMIKDD